METDIYQYDDFRIFIANLLQKKRSENPKYTFRMFASEAGFTNPGFVNDVIKGRRNLSKDAIEKMINVFSLTSVKADFFKLLVQYGQSKKEEEREAIYKNILFRRNRSKFTRLHPSLAKYYQDYRYPLIRSAIEVCDFRGDYEKFARFLDPSIQTSIIKKYVRDLCNWGLVRQNNNGRYRVTSKLVEPPETLSHLVLIMNKEWIKQAYEALQKYPKQKRHISTMLLNISEETNRIIQEKIEKMREEIFKIIEKEENPERIMQLNIQYFPKSKFKEQQ